MFFVYILQSETSGKFYIGFTTDVDRRVYEHNNELGRWTKGKGPWVLRYVEAFESETEARKRELQLKRMKSAKYLKWLIENGSGSSVG